MQKSKILYTAFGSLIGLGLVVGNNTILYVMFSADTAHNWPASFLRGFSDSITQFSFLTLVLMIIGGWLGNSGEKPQHATHLGH